MSASKMLNMLTLVVSIAMLGTSASQAGVRFGAKLTTNTFPSNAAQGQFCNEPDGPPHPKCTWVEMRAYNNTPQGHRAPKDGVVGTLRLISCIPGSFKLQIVRARPNLDEAASVREGPIVHYQGDPQHCSDNNYKIDVIAVHVPVKKGDYLAIKTKKTGMLRCDSGGKKILLFDPPLVFGNGFEEAEDDSGCFLLLEAEYK